MRCSDSKYWMIGLVLLAACDIQDDCPDYNGFPEEVGKIIITKCSTTGCHNDISKEAASGLSLESWNSLFQGSSNGNSAVIPYRSDLSFLSYFINTYDDLGPSVKPVMPVGGAPLTRDEVKVIMDWIDRGAPAANGYVKFNDPHIEKMFVINQGCDNVYMIDAASGLIMRAVDVGKNPSVIESPHYISTSRDDQYFYVCFYNGTILQRFRTSDGSFAGQAEIGAGLWNTFAISEDNRYAFVIDWSLNGTIAVVDLRDMTMPIKYQGSGLFKWPHGSAVKGKWLYVTAQTGNFIYKIDITDIFSPDIYQIPLQPGETPNITSKYDPHQIHFSPDGKEYVVTCQKSNEVRFFDVADDKLIAKVSTGKYPQHAHYSHSTNNLFVTCMEDDITYPGKIGSVSIIDYTTHTFVKSLFTGFQPHGSIIDDERNQVFILNRNVSAQGPAPHHASTCSGRNGYMIKIDMNTLNIIPDYKVELSVDPYYGTIMGHPH
jgi:DNA-binding beta-propeller fold protein YncE